MPPAFPGAPRRRSRVLASGRGSASIIRPRTNKTLDRASRQVGRTQCRMPGKAVLDGMATAQSGHESRLGPEYCNPTATPVDQSRQTQRALVELLPDSDWTVSYRSNPVELRVACPVLARHRPPVIPDLPLVAELVEPQPRMSVRLSTRRLLNGRIVEWASHVPSSPPFGKEARQHFLCHSSHARASA